MLADAGPKVLTLDATGTLTRRLDEAVRRSVKFLLAQQKPDGHWVGELEADTTLESDTIKLMHLLGRVDPIRQRRLARTLLKNQLPDGGWPIYHGGPAELNATVKAYVALRLAGREPDDPVLEKAREVILRLGGLERVNSFEKVYLALFNCYPWDQVPALPPEVLLLPDWFPYSIYEVAYWSRAILVPLAVIYATRPKLYTGTLTLEELWGDPARKRARMTNLQKGGVLWRVFFLSVDRLLKLHERLDSKPFRARALREAEAWMKERMEESDGLGAIFPAMVNAVFALKGLGYRDGDPFFERQVKELEKLDLPDSDDPEALKVQPCFSPVWDTALAMFALERSGLDEVRHAVRRGGQWLKSRQIRRAGDWAVKNREGKPGGWAFEYRNPAYPDVDDTAQVLLALKGELADPATGLTEPFQRGLDWVLSMQNRDGGWSSFDRDNARVSLNHFPFADHNAMLDPSACDITGRVLELLARVGLNRGHPAIQNGIRFLMERQEPDGSWYGRWGVNYLYGTWLALRGLKAVGEPMTSVRIARAGRWILSRQNPDGGWGESCRSYDDPGLKGQGPSTPSQTAWALMVLMSLEMVTEPGYRRGLDFLLRTQRPDGDWDEEPFTGTGFPRVFYLRYHLYRAYFPLLALSEARAAIR